MTTVQVDPTEIQVTVTDEPAASVTPTETTTAAVETTVDGTTTAVQVDEGVVEVQTPPAVAQVLETAVSSAVEVDVPAQATVALPVEVAPEAIEVDVTGPQGIQGAKGDRGDPGPAGPAGAGAAYVHYQNIASATWSITHNLGFFPAVTAIDSGGSNVEGDIAYPDANNVTVTFSAACGGVAYLS